MWSEGNAKTTDFKVVLSRNRFSNAYSGFNISYSIGNMKMILVNIVLSGILTYYLTRKKNSLDKESVVNDSQQS